jgi:pectinesterase
MDAGGSDTGVADTGRPDAPAGDTPDSGGEVDAPVADDAGADAAPAEDGAADGPGIECAPLPTGGTVRAGSAPPFDAGPVVTSSPTRPELSPELADGQYTIQRALAQGYLINSGVVPDGGVGAVTYSLNDNWDPQTNGIGDPSTFTPMFTVASDGSGTHTTLNAAFTDAIFLSTCSRVYIRVMPGVYRGQVLLASKASAPPITLYSTETDASKTVLVADAAGATAGNTSASATFTVRAIYGFQMKNMTVANDYVEGSATGTNQAAVAMLLQADRAQFENVRFLGNIGTLYMKSLMETIVARSYFRDCYVEGDQDFILGRGTAVFDHTEIRSLGSRQASGGVIAFPSTLVFNRYGFLFDSCTFTAEAGVTGVSLARQWVEESDTVATRGMAVGKVIVRNSQLGAHLAGAAPWSSQGARTTTPKAPSGTTPIVVYTSDDYFAAGVGPAPAEPFLAEYRNLGPGAHQ